MESWMLVPIAVLVLGAAVIAYGALRDRTRRAEDRSTLAAAPARAIPGLADPTAIPAYLDPVAARRPTAVADRLDDDALARLGRRVEGADPLPTSGWTHESYLTEPGPGWAVADDARVLVVDGGLDDPRLAVALLDRARRLTRSLVVVADGYAASVTEVLEINVVRGVARLVAVTADVDARRTVADALGATLVEVSDLQAGYLPDEHLGRAGCWVSSSDRSWALDAVEHAATSPEATP